MIQYVVFVGSGLTSYCVIRPLGSTGSSHLRKIMSSRGVKVSDSGAMPPGTIRNCQNKHLLENWSANPTVSLSCQYHRNECQIGSEQCPTWDTETARAAGGAHHIRPQLIYELHQLYKHKRDSRKEQENTSTVLYQFSIIAGGVDECDDAQ